MTQHYRFAGVAIASEIPLPLPAAGPVEPVSLTIRRSLDPTLIAASWEHASEVVPGDPNQGAGSMSVRLAGADYLMQVIDAADLRYFPVAGELHMFAPRDQWINTIEHVLLDQAIPRVLAYSGHLMLHASAVEVAGKALCFVGPSGAGKSTLAATFSLAGYRILADDVVRIEFVDGEPWIYPAYPSLRLCLDATSIMPAELNQRSDDMAGYSDKQVFRLWDDVPCPAGLPLGNVVLLQPADDTHPTLTLAAPSSALIRMMGQTFSLHPGVGQVEAGRLARMSRACSASRPLELVFRHSFGQRSALLNMLLARKLG